MRWRDLCFEEAVIQRKNISIDFNIDLRAGLRKEAKGKKKIYNSFFESWGGQGPFADDENNCTAKRLFKFKLGQTQHPKKNLKKMAKCQDCLGVAHFFLNGGRVKNKGRNSRKHPSSLGPKPVRCSTRGVFGKIQKITEFILIGL